MKNKTVAIIATTAFLIFAGTVRAQEIDLTVSPPLDVVQLQDTKPIILAFTIKNGSAADFSVVPTVHRFTSDDHSGQPQIDERDTVTFVDSQTPGITLGKPFTLAAHQSQQFVLHIVPPEGTKTDIQLTALMTATPIESDHLGQSATTTRVITGANMILQPTKTEVSELTLDLFETPAFIDVFEPIRVALRAHNNSLTLTQARGTLSLTADTKHLDQLTVFPDIVLATHSRDLRAILQRNGTNEPTAFLFNAPHFPGTYTLTTAIAQPNGTMKTYTKTVYILPFSLTGGALLIFAVILIIRTLHRRKSSSGLAKQEKIRQD